MHIEPRLWVFTAGVRGRIAGAVGIGLGAIGFGILRLVLLGWLLGEILAGRELLSVLPLAGAVVAATLLRGGFEQWRAMAAHRTAAIVQQRLRRTIHDRILALGAGAVAQERSGALSLSLVEGVEQLETYFGRFLPTFALALLSPLLIFGVVAFIDLPVAAVLLLFAAIALFAPALWHKRDVANSQARQDSYADYASEFLDSVQGLATLKAFGQSAARGQTLAAQARELSRRTMWVLATNVGARGITDSAIACGAAAALALGTWRVGAGEMSITGLLMILMLGTEVFRPMRELRTVLHQGMVGLSAAQGIFSILDVRPPVAEGAAAVLAAPLAPTFAFEGVGFHYPGTRRNVLDGLDFQAAAGERIGIVGASGGGKSSIVRLLLRQYDPDAGRVLIGGQDLRALSFAQARAMIAVVQQDSMLFHGTLEENLRLGRADATEAQIEAAARAANIHDFIAGLPEGYATLVGERGLKLSGGQRQRLAIARALLRDAPILVLDEALSAVDAENEAVIQEALDRLMRGRTTLVLAHRLSSVIGCDRILLLDGGRIAESGTHAALMRQGGGYARLMAEQAQGDDAGGGGAADVLLDAEEPAAATSAPGDPRAAPTEGILRAEGLGWGRLVALLFGMIGPWRGRLAATFVFGVLRVLAFIGVGVLGALVVLALRHGEPVAPLLWALAVLAPLSGVLHWLESWIAHDMAFRLLAELRIDVFRKLDALAPAYLLRRRSGDLMALATHDIELVEYFFAHTVAPAFVALLVPSAVLAVLALASPWLALTLLPFLLAAGLSPLLARGEVDRLGSAAREAAGELGAYAVDSVQGIAELIAFQQEGPRGDRLDALSARHLALRLPFFRQLTWQHSLLEVLTGLGGLAVVLVGAVLVAGGALDAALLPLLALLAAAAFLPVSEIAQVGRQLADTLGATRRLQALAEEPVPVLDGPGPVPVLAAPALRIEGVSFRYPGQARPALQGLDIAVPPGGTMALVGPSGAGKTTLAQLLMRFWDPEQGRITLDGCDLRNWPLDTLRRNVALVAQDTYLFNTTLRANILLARPEATEAQLATAIEQASLSELVASLPDGLDTPVGERGTALSGGQRQRVAIARACLKDAPVLILDEATSHLDAVNEAAVRGALDRLRANRTTIVIAHRLSTVREADLIVVLRDGRVAESGRHAVLLARGGLYARLVSRQLGLVAQSAE